MTNPNGRNNLEKRLRELLEDLRRLLNPEQPKPVRVPVPVRIPKDPRYGN
ncbi:MAG: hypothetical protein H6672_04670 [Anaerolineaceae bacterium]|nr:hypothetical protein [Anaerolineaceae bacterium]